VVQEVVQNKFAVIKQQKLWKAKNSG
jgi:hypothetical protein